MPLAPVEPGGKSERWWGEWGIGWLLVVLVCCGRLRYLARARVQQAWRVAVCTLHFPHLSHHASLWSAPTCFTIIPSPGLTRWSNSGSLKSKIAVDPF